MVAWLKFILLPIVVSGIVTLIFALLASVFHWEIGSWWNILGMFITSFFVGTCMYHTAPRYPVVLASVYAVLWTAGSVWSAIVLSGSEQTVMGTVVQHQIYWSKEIASAMALGLSIWGGHLAALEDQQHG